MSNVIRFLETLGQDAGASRMSAEHYAAAVAALALDDAPKQALLARDHAALNDLLGGRREMLFAFLVPAEDDDQAQTPPDDGDGQAPAKEALSSRQAH